MQMDYEGSEANFGTNCYKLNVVLVTIKLPCCPEHKPPPNIRHAPRFYFVLFEI
jgi:hypothetical protein